MKKLLLLPLLAACGGLAHADTTAPKTVEPAKPAAPELWHTDFAEAQKLARQEKKTVIVFFTGSDWCGWCKKLDAQILSTDTFKKWADKKAVMVKADFPHKTKLPAAEAAQNEKLSQKYGISGFPTLVIIDRHGNLLGESGYKDLTPDAYVKDLESIIAGKGRKK